MCNKTHVPSKTTILSALAIVESRCATIKHVVCLELKILSIASFTCVVVDNIISVKLALINFVTIRISKTQIQIQIAQKINQKKEKENSPYVQKPHRENS